MIIPYYPTEGQKPQAVTTSKYFTRNDKYIVNTKFELKGRGIRYIDTDDYGINRYELTERAYEKLSKEINIAEAMYLD